MARVPASPAADRARLVETAVALGDRLRALAVPQKDGGITWLRQAGASAGPASVDPHLYSGSTGIALFLAALEKVLGGGTFGDLSLRALAGLRRKLAALAADPAAARKVKLGIGGLSGFGAFVYAFASIGRLLDEPELVAEARGLIGLFTRERIAGDESFDLAEGAAGAVLALVTLERLAAPEAPAALAAANACADHLLAGRRSHDGGPRAWPPVRGKPPLSGLAHGTAGICLALLRLHDRTGRPELLAAAREALAYERGLFDPGHRNWRDMRAADVRFMTSWCHGAPGIGLARLATLELFDDGEVRREIAAALDTTRAAGLTELDHLCCGNLGLSEVLLYASGILGDAAPLAAAHDLAARVLSRAAMSGGFALAAPGEQEPLELSLFKGIAGIGFGLLRLATGGELPCPLLLE